MSEDHAYYQLKELIRDEMLEQSPDLAKIMAKYKALTAAKDAEIRNLKSLNSALESDNANNSMNLEHLSSQLSEKDAHFIEHSKSEAQIIEDLRYCNVALKAEISQLQTALNRTVKQATDAIDEVARLRHGVRKELAIQSDLLAAEIDNGESFSPVAKVRECVVFELKTLLSPADGESNRLEDVLEETAPDGYEIVTFTKKKSNEH